MGSGVAHVAGESPHLVCPPRLVHPEEPGRSGSGATLAVVCLATALLLLNVSAPNVELPAIGRSLHAPFADLQWIVSGYALALAALLLVAGTLADRLGRRRLFVGGLALFAASSLLCALAPTTIVLVGARGLQGVSAAILFSSSLALLATEFQGPDRARALGIWGATVAAAFGAGPLVGGALTDVWSWRGSFLVNVILAVPAIPFSLRRLHESHDESVRHTDWSGAGLLSVAIFLGIFGLIRGNALGWGSGVIEGSLAASAALVAAFVAIETRRAEPMVDLKLFRNPTFTAASLVALVLSGVAFGIFFYVTIFLLTVRGASPLAAGLEVAPYAFVALVVSMGMGRISARLPVRTVLAVGLALCGVGLFLFHGVDASSSWPRFLPGLAVLGAGVGLANPAVTFAALGVVPPERSGMASGMNTTFRQLGAGAGVAALGAVLESRVASHVLTLVDGTRAAGDDARAVAHLAGAGDLAAALGHVPADARTALVRAHDVSFAGALGTISVIGALVALAAAALAFLLVRERDFVVTRAPRAEAEPEPA